LRQGQKAEGGCILKKGEGLSETRDDARVKREEDRMKAVEVYCREFLELGADGAKGVDPRSVITAEWVRMKCQFGCPGFGTSRCCPPHTPAPDLTRKVVDSYQKAILVHRKLPKGEKTKAFNESIVKLEIKLFLDGYYKAWSMGSGPCRLCQECDLTTSCKHGLEARPSMEACGIDVFKTARDNGFSIEVVRTREEERNIFGLILVE
jgi:predicted metal-binding protein